MKRRPEIVKLRVRDSLALLKALSAPPAPNAKLRAAAERYKTRVKS